MELTKETTTTVGCRLTWRKRDALHTLALANNSNVTDLLRTLVDGALAETGVDLTAPVPEPEDQTPALLGSLTSQVADLQEQVGNLTALVRELVTTPAPAPAAPALTLNVPGLAPVSELAQRQLDAQKHHEQLEQQRADALWAEHERVEAEKAKPRLLAELRKQQKQGLTVSEVGYDGKVWVWRKGLGSETRRAEWLHALGNRCGCDPTHLVEVSPDARKLPSLKPQDVLPARVEVLEAVEVGA